MGPKDHIYSEQNEGSNIPKFGIGSEINAAKTLNSLKLDNQYKENQYPFKDNIYKRRKSSMDVESLIPTTTNRSIIGRLSRIENDQNTRVSKLNRDIEFKQQEIQNISTKIMTLQTQTANQEFEVFKLDDQYLKLKEKLGIVDEEINELKHHEQESLKELEVKYELETEKLKLNHDEKIHDLTLKAENDINKIIHDNVIRFENEKLELKNECEGIEKTIKSQEQDLNRKLIRMKEDHSRRMIQLDQDMDESLVKLGEEIEEMEDSIESKKLMKDEIEIENLEIDSKHEKILIEFNKLKEISNGKEEQLEEIQKEINGIEQMIKEVENSFQSKDDEIIRLQQETKVFIEGLAKQEHSRRVLHNRLQDLKGNIRVYCRIRPPIDAINAAKDLTTFDILNDSLSHDAKKEMIISRDPTSENSSIHSYSMRNNTFKFQFDQILSMDTDNNTIFKDVSQLIQSCLDGYNVCVFAYGQTGSGKTWTMSHPQHGMIPLSIQKIFNDIEELKTTHWEYSLVGQFLEIYNEQLIDLLAPSKKKLDIKHNETDSTTTVTNLTSIPLTSSDQFNQILNKAMKNRSTAATKSNERSSRSHSIFILKLEGKNFKTNKICRGTLNLIDLAGSERLASSLATGDRLKETQAINKSLSCLGDVIHALGQKSNQALHIPYRNSKLTYLLKNSLGGSSKTLMFVNVSPLLKNFGETINSLRFATKVNSTKLGS
ncbi:kinesin-like protein Kar3p [[Candida] anglica]|uniref:Kinesin-like protein n=1 Tax=[Candida] anglica TaxID=148631 RepID=A0ABP0E8A6_9ASCO